MKAGSNISIIGPGAIGGVTAAWLIQSGRHRVTLCARKSFAELRVETPNRSLHSHPTIVDDPARATEADWVLVATKAYDAAGAAAWFTALGKNARVAILQNGVEHIERFTPFLDASRIVPVVVDIPSERTAPGQVRQRGPGKLTVADDALGREFAALFAGTDLEVILTPDFRSATWRKLCLNAAGVISALVLQPARIMGDDAIAQLATGIIREGIAVGRAEGAVLDDSLAETIVQRYRNAPPDSVNSLHADRQAKRPTEIDARNGVIVRLGRKHGIATPYNEMAVALLNVMSAKEASSSR